MATTVEHGQLAQVDSSGNVTVLYPKTFTSDIYVGNTSTTLSTLLGSTNISSIGDGTITGAISSLNNDNVPITRGGTGASTASTARTNLGINNMGTYTYSVTTSTLNAASWSSEGVYSFTGTYPSASYDIFVLPRNTCTAEQIAAFGAAGILSNNSANTITAVGAVPTVNIPIIIIAIKKA